MHGVKLFSPGRSRGSERSQLLQKTELVGDRPALDDLAAGEAVDVDAGQRDLLAGGRDALERAGVGALGRPAGDHAV